MATKAAKNKSAINTPDGRELVLDTAAKLFRVEGYASTSLRDIAAEAGMRAASLYHHFESKDAIVSEVLRIGVERVFEHVKQAIDELPPNAGPRSIGTCKQCFSFRTTHRPTFGFSVKCPRISGKHIFHCVMPTNATGHLFSAAVQNKDLSINNGILGLLACSC